MVNIRGANRDCPCDLVLIAANLRSKSSDVINEGGQ